MALDPAVDAALTQLANAVAALRVLLTGNPPPPPPPPPPLPPDPTTPISILLPRETSTTLIRSDATHVHVTYELAGTLSRATQMAVAVVGGSWQTFPAPTATTGAVDVVVPAAIGKGKLHLHVWDKGLKAGVGDWVISSNVSYPASDQPPLPPPPPPPPPPGKGKLSFGHDTLGQPVFTIDDKPSVLIGCNGSGQHGYWGGGLAAAGHSSSWPGWGWNFLRLFEQLPGGGECQFCPDANGPTPTAATVQEYTDRGIVVMLDFHHFDFGSELTPAHTATAQQWWQTMANTFKGNPLVIFEACNEPEATFHSYTHGATDWASAYRMMNDRWLTFGKAIIDTIRGTGAENIIVFDDSQAGQGCDDFWNIGLPSSGSSVIGVGRQLVDYDPLHRVAFSVHTYDAFGWSTVSEQNSQCDVGVTGPGGDARRNARLADHVKRCYSATGVPLIAGEFGWQVGESATQGVGFHYPYTTCGSRTLRAQRATTQAGRALSLSTTEWNGFQLTTNGNNGFDSANLTACGQDYMAYCQAMKNGPTGVTAPDIDDAVAELREAPHVDVLRPTVGSLEEFLMYRPQRQTGDWTTR